MTNRHSNHGLDMFQEMSKMEPIYPFPLCNKENVVMKAASQSINCLKLALKAPTRHLEHLIGLWMGFPCRNHNEGPSWMKFACKLPSFIPQPKKGAINFSEIVSHDERRKDDVLRCLIGALRQSPPPLLWQGFGKNHRLGNSMPVTANAEFDRHF